MRHKKQLELISRDDFINAGINWQKFWQPDYHLHKGFFEFLGISSFVPNGEELRVTHHIARKVRLLNSPHHHAFLMAYKLRKGNKK